MVVTHLMLVDVTIMLLVGQGVGDGKSLVLIGLLQCQFP